MTKRTWEIHLTHIFQWCYVPDTEMMQFDFELSNYEKFTLDCIVLTTPSTYEMGNTSSLYISETI